MSDSYYIRHLPSGTTTETSWPEVMENLGLIDGELTRLRLINQWNRAAMLMSMNPEYHYWM